MAVVGKKITNTKINQSYRFIQTAKSSNGSLLEIEAEYGPFSKEPPLHYHPHQEEYFEILCGELKVTLNGITKTLKQGDQLHIPPNIMHAMWNASNKPAIVNWKTIPALNTEYLFENITGLANDHKTNAEGKPSLLQLALTAGKFSDVFRAAKPPYFLQKILFALLSPFARIADYKPVYKKYID